MYWSAIITILAVMFIVCAYSFYKRYSAHKQYCEFLRKSLQEAVPQKDNDYSALLPAGLVVGEYLWQIYTIDPSVIKAVDFSSTQNLDSAYAVSNYLMINMLEHDDQAYSGFKNRLIGYVGEQKVAEVLQQQGTDALWASTSNQEIWDLKIDDQLINVKTVLDINSIKGTALAHPDVTYLVPEDTYRDIGIDNIQPLDGFNYQEVTDQLNSTYQHIDGSNAFNAFSTHLPIGSGIIALKERQRLLNAGGDQQAVNRNVLIDFSAKTAGSLTMAKIGGLIGAGLGSLVFTPVLGGTLGAALGAFWGAKKGKAFGKVIKELELQKQKLKLNVMLEKFGKQYFPYIDKIKYQISSFAYKNQFALASFEAKYLNSPSTKNWKSIFFENTNEVFFTELKRIGENNFAKEKLKADKQNIILDEIRSAQNTKALALLIINNIHFRDFLYVDLIELKLIYAQKDKVYLERFKLYPDQYPLTQKLRDHKKLYNTYTKDNYRS